MDGRTYRVALEGFEATPIGFGQHLTGIVSAKTDLISGRRRSSCSRSRIGVLRKLAPAPPQAVRAATLIREPPTFWDYWGVMTVPYV